MTLTGKKPGNTYKQLLYVGSGNIGLEAAPKTVYSGAGVASTLQLSTSQVVIDPALVGTAAAPALAFGDADTGFYEGFDDTLYVSIGGIARLVFNSSGIQTLAADPAPILTLGQATAINPNHTFSTDRDTGLGTAGSDQLSLIAGGVEMLRLVETGTSATDQIIIAPAGIIGSEATPALAFGDGDSGFYENVDDSLRLTLGGTNRLTFAGGFIQATATGGLYLRLGAGSSTLPVHSFLADENTGVGRAAADQLSIIAGGVEGIRVSEDTNKLIIDLKGAVGYKVTEVNAATYTIQLNDHTIAVDYTATGAVTITLPAASDAFNGTEGLRFLIKDTGVNSGTNNITINRAGSDTIITTTSGNTSATISANGNAFWIQAKDSSTWIVY